MSKIKDYFLQINNRTQINIPEWDATIWVGPLTIMQWGEIKKVEHDDIERNLAVIRVCSKNEQGQPAFSPKQIMEMRQYGTPQIINRLSVEILTTISPKQEADEEGEKLGED